MLAWVAVITSVVISYAVLISYRSYRPLDPMLELYYLVAVPLILFLFLLPRAVTGTLVRGLLFGRDRSLDLALEAMARGMGAVSGPEGWVLPGGLVLRFENNATQRTVTVGPVKRSITILPREGAIAATEAAEVKTGDTVFDECFQVSGDPAEVLGLLSQDIRRKLLVAKSSGTVTLKGRVLRGSAPADAHESSRFVHLSLSVVAAAQALVSAQVRSLEVVASEDLTPAVRLTALKTLLGGSNQVLGVLTRVEPVPAVEGQLWRALGDSDASVRVYAALQLGAAGQEALVKVVEDRSQAVLPRVEALRGLRALPRERLVPLLAGLLDGFDAEGIQAAAVVAVEALRWRELGAPLASAMKRFKPAQRAAAAKALGAVGGPDAEDGLLALLGEEDPATRIAAIDALGLCGSVRCVESLRAMKSRWVVGRESAALSAAIDRIQGRLLHADAGQLAMAGQGGELSPANEAGTLSLAGRRGVKAGA